MMAKLGCEGCFERRVNTSFRPATYSRSQALGLGTYASVNETLLRQSTSPYLLKQNLT